MSKPEAGLDSIRPSSMRPFFIVWIGQAFSLLGSQLVQFALVWWLTQETGSASVLAAATFAALLPQIVVSPFAGALVDRWSRKRVMIAADTASALAALLLAVLFAVGPVTPWMIYGLLLVRSTAAAFHWPAMQASTTMMVPAQHLARVGGLNQTLVGLAGILVPPAAALACVALPMQSILMIDVATAVPAIGALLLVAIPQPARAGAGLPGRSLLADMREGLHFLLGWRALLYLSLVGLVVGILGRASAAMIPLMVTRVFGQGVVQLGWWESAYGAGMIAGGLILGAWGGAVGVKGGIGRGSPRQGWRRIATSMLALALDGVVCMLIGLTPRDLFPLTVGGLALLGIFEAMIFGINGTIGQATVPPEMQGRVFSLVTGVSQAAAPLGLLAAGPFADRFGVQAWWLLSSGLIFLTGMAALFTPSLMRIDEGAPAAMYAAQKSPAQ